ncbi:MAG TPA: hypothetical protein VFV50_03860 [Bdellovibrionales bacterium]|nr:hypothetical protein [Bdellovibrionales bacterium]
MPVTARVCSPTAWWADSTIMAEGLAGVYHTPLQSAGSVNCQVRRYD